MKKISIIASLLLLLGIGVSGCKEDTQPRLEIPTEFVLNTPPAAEQLYIFRADSKNNSRRWHRPLQPPQERSDFFPLDTLPPE